MKAPGAPASPFLQGSRRSSIWPQDLCCYFQYTDLSREERPFLAAQPAKGEANKSLQITLFFTVFSISWKESVGVWLIGSIGGKKIKVT